MEQNVRLIAWQDTANGSTGGPRRRRIGVARSSQLVVLRQWKRIPHQWTWTNHRNQVQMILIAPQATSPGRLDGRTQRRASAARNTSLDVLINPLAGFRKFTVFQLHICSICTMCTTTTLATGARLTGHTLAMPFGQRTAVTRLSRQIGRAHV